MKKIDLSVFIIFCLAANALGQNKGVTFISSDTSLEQAFTWAKGMALHYRGDPRDSVGPWYESSLPGRAAFCMRDVSHQCIGAEILGMSKENENMLTKFVSNISASKNWCSYWEINKWNKPAPADYRNDSEFWYNLDANFDIVYASWRLYLWTGDKTYIRSPAFLNFDEKTLNNYIREWVLTADSLLTRSSHPHVPTSFDETAPFHRNRGLPSYAESVPGLKMSADLIAAIYQGLSSYAAILKLSGDEVQSRGCARKAERYRELLESDWWDTAADLYNTYYTNDGRFGKGEGEAFLLWFDILKDTARITATINHLAAVRWNIENTSYLPYLLYLKGRDEQAYKYLLYLSDPGTKRREYPEVSYGVIQGIVLGYMGIEADARIRTIRTLFRGTAGVMAELDNLPVLNTLINVKYNGTRKMTATNKGDISFHWRPAFRGKHAIIYIDDKPAKARIERDMQGNTISSVGVIVKPGRQVKAHI